jgi:hypothetical protein
VGRYCRICGIQKLNEKFSGTGHKNYICKKCSKLPTDKREAKEQAEEIYKFMNQSRISDKNIKRLKIMNNSENLETVELANVVLDIARIAPNKKNRFKILSQKRRDLLKRLEILGLI